MNINAKKIHIQNMYCSSCENLIEEAVREIPGVKKVKSSYGENMVYVEYDFDLCSLERITQAINMAGYTVGTKVQQGNKFISVAGMLLVFLAVFLLSNYASGFDMGSKLIGKVTYFVLFAIGLFTSLHCIGMCGGILLSQTIAKEPQGKRTAFYPSLFYNMGRVLGYTALGGVVGAIGSVLSVSLSFMSGVSIFAGIFMIVMGLNMAGFNIFRRYLRIPLSTPSVTKKVKTPFFVGILNGLMPCGPLQTMQIYALSTGSAFSGAAPMFVFALGTVPLMLSFGTLASLFSKNSTKRILKFSGVLVIILGLIMTSRGLSIAGYNSFANLTAKDSKPSVVTKVDLSNGVQIIKMSANSQGYVPNVLYVQKGVPVKWIIEGEQITSCNNEIIIPSLNMKKKLSPGENVIEFPPQDQDIKFSCWMGMINGVIKVVDDVSAVDKTNEKSSATTGSGCCNLGGSGGQK